MFLFSYKESDRVRSDRFCSVSCVSEAFRSLHFIVSFSIRFSLVLVWKMVKVILITCMFQRQDSLRVIISWEEFYM